MTSQIFVTLESGFGRPISFLRRFSCLRPSFVGSAAVGGGSTRMFHILCNQPKFRDTDVRNITTTVAEQNRLPRCVGFACLTALAVVLSEAIHPNRFEVLEHVLSLPKNFHRWRGEFSEWAGAEHPYGSTCVQPRFKFCSAQPAGLLVGPLLIFQQHLPFCPPLCFRYGSLLPISCGCVFILHGGVEYN